MTETVQSWINGEAQYGLLVKAQSEASAPLTRFVAQTDSFGSTFDGDPYLSIRYRHRTGALRQYSFDTQELSDRQSIGVNLANANVLVQASDLAAPGTGLDLEVERFYNSRDLTVVGMDREAIGSVGRGWTLSLGPDVGLEIYSFDGGSAVFYGPSGFAVHFPKKTDRTFEAPLHGLEAKLAQVGSEYVLTMNRSGHKYTFNSAGFLIKEEDRNANDIRYSYDAQNRLTQITDTQDRVVSAAYNAQGLIETLTDWTGRVARYGYDTNKRLTSFTDTAGKVTTYTYDGSHKLTKITDPLLQETRITYAAGSEDRYEVNVKRVTDPSTGAGSNTRYQTCPRGQGLCPPDDPTWEDGQPRTHVTDPNGNKTTFYTDLHSRVHKLKDALTRVQSLVLNANHNVEKYTSARPADTLHTYSNDGRFNLQKTQLPTTADTSWSYDTSENAPHPYHPQNSTDPQGKLTSYGYDAKGNLQTVTNALGRAASVVRDPANGNVLQSTDFKGITTNYSYYPNGNLQTVDNPTPLGDVTYAYDPVGRVRLGVQVSGRGC